MVETNPGDYTMKLDDIPTCELVDEIERRGYTKTMVPPYGIGYIRVSDVNEDVKYFQYHDGPVVILAIND